VLKEPHDEEVWGVKKGGTTELWGIVFFGGGVYLSHARCSSPRSQAFLGEKARHRRGRGSCVRKWERCGRRLRSLWGRLFRKGVARGALCWKEQSVDAHRAWYSVVSSTQKGVLWDWPPLQRHG